MPADCERVLINDFPFHAGLRAVREPVRWRRAGLAFAFECPASAPSACRVRPVVRRGKTLVASAPRTVRIARGQTATVSLNVTTAGRRLLGGRATYTVRDRGTSHGWKATYG